MVWHVINIYNYLVVVVVLFSGSHGTLLGVLNAYVHVIMYTYYFLTSVKPELDLRAYKIHITHLQLVRYYVCCVALLWPNCLINLMCFNFAGTIRHIGCVFPKSDRILWLCISNGDISDWRYTKSVYVHSIFGLLFEGLR